MTTNPVRRALLQRRVTIGTWVQMSHPASPEILAAAGFDWIAADCEHTDIGVRDVADLCRAMGSTRTVPLVRVAENQPLAIRKVLDMGAMGVIVPLVNSAKEAECAVRAAKYPPRGVRGYCFSRMNRWGADFDRHAKTANDNTAVMVMIESQEAAENIEEILAVDGVDGVFVGPYDMSGSFGVPGRTDSPQVRKACRRVIAACRRSGTSAGLHVVLPTPRAIRTALADGFTFLALGIDTVFLREGAAAALATARGVKPRST
jgi:2-keto-3-deoxy-L-rhamnonate aldolase RhmA